MTIPPSISQKLRACLGCSLVKTQTQFRDEGCDNCQALKMKNALDVVLDCTSDTFSGLIAVTSNKDSWVAQWQHIDGFVPGMYAITVEGELPEGQAVALEREGRTLLPRDKPFVI